MSCLNLSRNIVRLRKEKNITQEDLADFAGVTKASVSKWETGTTTPDVHLLPVLAAFFDVSVDELLGYESQLTSKQIKYYYHKLARDFAQQDFETVWNECLELVKKYYSCYSFLMQMAVLFVNHSTLPIEVEKKVEVLFQAENLCNRVIENCEQQNLRDSAEAIRGMIWMQQGKAKQIIASLEEAVLDINHMNDNTTLLPMAYLSVGDLSMAEKTSQINSYRHLLELINNQVSLLMSAQDVAYCREVLHRMDQIMELFALNQLHPNVVASYEYQAALKLNEMGAAQDEILERMEAYVRSVCNLYKDDLKIHGDDYFNRLEEWLEGLDLGVEPVRDGKVILETTIASLQHPAFANLQNQKRMEACRRKLQALIKEIGEK